MALADHQRTAAIALKTDTTEYFIQPFCLLKVHNELTVQESFESTPAQSIDSMMPPGAAAPYLPWQCVLLQIGTDTFCRIAGCGPSRRNKTWAIERNDFHNGYFFHVLTFSQTAPSNDCAHLAMMYAISCCRQTNGPNSFAECHRRVHSQYGHIAVQGPHIEISMAHHSFYFALDVQHFVIGFDIVVAQANG